MRDIVAAGRGSEVAAVGAAGAVVGAGAAVGKEVAIGGSVAGEAAVGMEGAIVACGGAAVDAGVAEAGRTGVDTGRVAVSGPPPAAGAPGISPGSLPQPIQTIASRAIQHRMTARLPKPFIVLPPRTQSKVLRFEIRARRSIFCASGLRKRICAFGPKRSLAEQCHKKNLMGADITGAFPNCIMGGGRGLGLRS